jgi:ABC-2 type transport system ATP-binding protein
VTDPSAAIVVEGLVREYAGRRVVDDVTFSVGAGSLVGLLGPNGAGKTTTVEMLEGYRRPTAGTVRVLGLDPVADATELRARIGVMLQAGGLYPLATPRELVRLFARFFARPRDPDALLDTVGLGVVAADRVRTLSGGERQRLGLALALVGRPALLILDEPTAGMDPAAKQSTRMLMAAERDAGTTILLTTHELADVERLADRVLVLDRGRLVADAAPDRIADAGGGTLRFRLERSLDDGDRLSLGAALRGTVVSEPGGWSRLTSAGEPASPATVGALARWCETNRIGIVEVRVGGGTLEDRYLELIGAAGGQEER